MPYRSDDNIILCGLLITSGYILRLEVPRGIPVVPGGFDDTSTKLDVSMDVVLFRHGLPVSQDLGSLGVFLGPLGIRLKR